MWIFISCTCLSLLLYRRGFVKNVCCTFGGWYFWKLRLVHSAGFLFLQKLCFVHLAAGIFKRMNVAHLAAGVFEKIVFCTFVFDISLGNILRSIRACPASSHAQKHLQRSQRTRKHPERGQWEASTFEPLQEGKPAISPRRQLGGKARLESSTTNTRLCYASSTSRSAKNVFLRLS